MKWKKDGHYFTVYFPGIIAQNGNEILRKPFSPYLYLFIIVIFVLLFFTSCGGDNAYDGENGLIVASSISGKDSFSSIQQNVLIPNADSFVQNSKTLNEQLTIFENETTKSNLIALQTHFKSLMLSWKSVQATFVAGDFDNNMIDLPLLIDHFHTGNEDIATLLDKVLSLSGELKGLLYKNSTKGVNALEYLLFGEANSADELLTLMNKDDKRRISACRIVIDNLEQKALEVLSFYQSDTKFIADATIASDSLVNVLIDSAYKLKEWRLGDGAGLTVKYKNRPDSRRLEYYRSSLSLDALKAIVEAHALIMHSQSFENFASFASQNGATIEVKEIQTNLDSVLSIANSFETPLKDQVESQKINELYIAVAKLYDSYYVSLINALNITSKIIEADGD